MELNKYDIFVQIIKNGSLTKTAQKIGYTQSAISHLVSSLESELGVSLLVRSRSGISLTPEGKALFPYIQSISKSYTNLYDCANQLQGLQSGTVRISTTQSIATQILPNTIAQFQQLYPNVRYELNIGGYFSNFQNVNDGISDFGFICMNEASSYQDLHRCQEIPFTNEKMVAIIPTNHPLADADKFPVEALQNEKYILIKDGTSETRPIFKQHNITPNILFYMDDAYSIMAMVEKGIGISIIPEMSAYRNPYHIYAKELSVPAYRTISIIYRKLPLISNAAKVFIDMLLEHPAIFSHD